MIHITIIAPYLEMSKEVEACQLVLNDPAVAIEVKELVGVAALQQLPIHADAVISRGATATALRKALPPNCILVELPVTGADVLRVLLKVKERVPYSKIALVAPPNMLNGVEEMIQLLDEPIHSYPVLDEETAIRQIQACKKKGIEMVVGGSMVTTLAARYGMNAEMIYSGKDSVLLAINEAVRSARLAQRERARSERFRTTLDLIEEVIFSFNSAGELAAQNAKAFKLLADSAEGEHANAIPKLRAYVERVLKKGRSETDIIIEIGNKLVTGTVQPVIDGQSIVGAVAAFQEAGAVHEREVALRHSFTSKGHRAKYSFRDCAGRSAKINNAVDRARRFSAVDSSILIYGETGTGKEVFAQSIHAESKRKNGPFVAVNCAAINDNLLESELFGYVSGAFTGARKNGKPGMFEIAHTGTIFLDEISEIPFWLQGRLLRVLQEHEVMRLGDDKVIPVDVRVIAASNKDLRQLAREGKFRTDLLFRLNILELHLPPLRERKEDIPALVTSFLSYFNTKYKTGKLILQDAALWLLMHYDWPGNIRELRNICERTCVLSPQHIVTEEDLKKILENVLQADMPTRAATAAAAPWAMPCGAAAQSGPAEQAHLDKAVLGSSYAAIQQALAATHGHMGKAASLLGVSRVTLWRKLKEYEKSVSGAAG